MQVKRSHGFVERRLNVWNVNWTVLNGESEIIGFVSADAPNELSVVA